MGVEDNYYQITNLDANTTFYDWVNKENDDVIAKLNLMSIYGVSAGNGLDVVIGSTGNSYDAGTAILSLSETIPGITVSGNLVVTGSIDISDGTSATSLVTSVNGQTGAVSISLGVTGGQGPTGPAGTTPDPIFISKNQLINGNFDVWQRGTGFTGKTNKYFADRWVRFATPDTLSSIIGGFLTRAAFDPGQTEVLGSPTYYARSIVVHSGFTSSDFVGIENRIEGSEKFIGETIYVDGYLRMEGISGATVGVYVRRNIDGSTGNYVTEEFSEQVYVQGTTWTDFFVSHDIGYTSGSTYTSGYVAVGFKVNDIPSSQALYMSNIRVFATQGETLESSPFRESTDPQEELRRCSRFYQRSYALNENNGSTSMLNSFDPDFTSVRFSVTPNNEYYYDFNTQMVTSPSVTIYSPSTGTITDGFNKTAGLDMRLTSGTSGWNGNIRLHSAGQSTLSTTSNTNGIIFHIDSGAVIFDDIFVHFVADSDYTV
jgi:hypothetical protein